MRDIPVFTTDFGVASLFLKNVAYNKTAYIKLHDATDTEKLLKACCEFCCNAGAEKVIASGHEFLKQYEIYTKVIKMKKENHFPETAAKLLPVQEDTMEEWRNIYNEKMLNTPAASQISFFEAKKYLNQGGCYFVHMDNVLIGIGLIAENEIRVIASVQKGAGKDIVAALAERICADTVEVQVADNNARAIGLYSSLGFESCGVVETWYKII